MWKMVSVLALAMTAATGCAALGMERGPRPQDELAAGLEALANEDFAAAAARLEPLYRRHWMEPVGQQALLALAALHLDPRNPERRLWATADLAARYIGLADAAAWTQPLAESLYLVALELGAADDLTPEARLAAEQAAEQARLLTPVAEGRQLPELPVPTVPTRIAEAQAERARVQAERDNVQRRVEQLEAQVAARDSLIRARDQELERIRRTIRH
jgi:hypothetical protein